MKLSEVYETAVKYVKEKRPELVEKLTKNVGFGMGIEFREAALLITNKTNVRAKKGERCHKSPDIIQLIILIKD